jgi:hypothetical protein
MTEHHRTQNSPDCESARVKMTLDVLKKVPPFYFPLEYVSEEFEQELIALFPFAPKDSNYWERSAERTMMGCANTYVFTCDSEQGACFIKLRPQQVPRWIKTHKTVEVDSEDDKLDHSACRNMTNRDGDQYFYTRDEINAHRTWLGLPITKTCS